jgi:hypothetical protein
MSPEGAAIEISVEARRQFAPASIFVRKPDEGKLALFTVCPAGSCRLAVVSEGPGADLDRLWPVPAERYVHEALILIYYGGLTA